MDYIAPGLPLLVLALFGAFLPHRLRQAYLLGIIGVSALCVLYPAAITFSLFGIGFVPPNPSALALPFALVFHIAAALNVIYAMPEKSRITDISGAVYAGAAIAALYAEDFLTLFVYWEFTALASVLLILMGKGTRRIAASMRYLLMQIGSGVLLLMGAAVLFQDNPTLSALHIGLLDPTSLAGFLILIAFGIKAAFPFLNGWLQDAYPQASISGTVILSAFTTKLAIYMLARCFTGFEPLIYIGAIMAVFPIFFAVIENDLRRVLSFSLNNQLGFMVVGIGIGSELALNGVVAHAFAHIIYKALLFMSMGAVLYRAGTVKATQLGGLWKSMPLTMIFCLIGVVSIASFPLFSGFVTKTLTIGSAAYAGYSGVWLALIFASTGSVAYGIKIPYSAFFAHDKGHKVKEAPLPMLIAMGIAACLCIFIGIAPHYLYALLPYAVTYEVWTSSHVLAEMQLLLFATLAFILLMVRGLYPPEIESTILNTDWVLRRFLPRLIIRLCRPFWHVYRRMVAYAKTLIFTNLARLEDTARHTGFAAGTLSTGRAAAILLGLFAFALAFEFLV